MSNLVLHGLEWTKLAGIPPHLLLTLPQHDWCTEYLEKSPVVDCEMSEGGLSTFTIYIGGRETNLRFTVSLVFLSDADLLAFKLKWF